MLWEKLCSLHHIIDVNTQVVPRFIPILETGGLSESNSKAGNEPTEAKNTK